MKAMFSGGGGMGVSALCTLTLRRGNESFVRWLEDNQNGDDGKVSYEHVSVSWNVILRTNIIY